MILIFILLVLMMALNSYRENRHKRDLQKWFELGLNAGQQSLNPDRVELLMQSAIERGMPRRVARGLAHQLRTGGRPRQKGNQCPR